MFPKNARFSHTAVAAYLAGLALGGSSWAATQAGVDVAGVAGGKAGVKVRCSAQRAGGHRVQGRQGLGRRAARAAGPARVSGSSGSSGSTVLTEPPGFSIESGGDIDFEGGGG